MFQRVILSGDFKERRFCKTAAPRAWSVYNNMQPKCLRIFGQVPKLNWNSFLSVHSILIQQLACCCVCWSICPVYNRVTCRKQWISPDASNYVSTLGHTGMCPVCKVTNNGNWNLILSIGHILKSIRIIIVWPQSDMFISKSTDSNE